MRPAVIPAALLILAAACSEGSGSLEGARLQVTGCGGEGGERIFEQFRISFCSFKFDRERGPLFIRAQSHGQVSSGADELGLVIDDEAAFREWYAENGAAPVEVGTPGSPVRGALLLADTCPGSFDSLVLSGGEARFKALGRVPGDRVRVILEGLEITDLRSQRVVGEDFGGELDFVIVGRWPSSR